MQIRLTVNEQAHELDVPDNTLLVDLLRSQLGLTGTHVGCDTSQCGACRRTCRRTLSQILHDARGASGRPSGHDH